MSTAIQKFSSHEELALSLQREVDAILSQVSEADIYAEFRERDIFEIEDGVHHRIVENVLDERINTRLDKHKAIDQVRIYERPSKKEGLIKRFFYFLFKQFEI